MRKPRKAPSRAKSKSREFVTPKQLRDMVEPQLTAPDGLSYQWFADEKHVLGAAIIDGWSPVPAWRHAKEIARSATDPLGRVVFEGTVCLERLKPLTDAVLKKATAEAIAQDHDHPAKLDRSVSGGHYSVLSPGFIVSRVYDQVQSNAPVVNVKVEIVVQADGNMQDAAASLGLSVTEYVRRVVILSSRGENYGVLLPVMDMNTESGGCAPFAFRHLNYQPAGKY